VASNILGIVGTASWGPVNSAVSAASYAQASQSFGPIQARAHDLGTAVTIAQQQGANAFSLVRVTDGTDTAATAMIQTNGGTATAKYTGSLGASVALTIAQGSALNTFKVTISLPGGIPETFDNIPGTGAAAWTNIASAINNGNAVRRASNIIVFAAGASTVTPIFGSYTLGGGSDGASGITSVQLIGVDGAARTGMYALRGSGSAIALLADCATPTTWSVQLAYGLSESTQLVDANAAGDTPTTFAAAMTTAGVDNPWFKAMLGDWCYWTDTVNGVTRLVSPAAFYAGWKASNPPNQSALNKPLNGIVGTQRSMANQTYSSTDLATIAAARGDVICNPCPGGAYFGCRFGRNSSSDPTRHQDAYTTMTNFLAVSLDLWGGTFVGQVMTPSEQQEAQDSIGSFLAGLQSPTGSSPLISAYSVAVTSNNATGTQVAVVMATYFGIVEYFIIDLTGGQSVVVQSTNPLTNA
jgi:hypothetical protein